MRVLTIGHGTRSINELVQCLLAAGAQTVVDVRRYPGSRRNPQFNQEALRTSLGQVEIDYRHALELGGRLRDEPGAERFDCIREPAFRSYLARIGTVGWQRALREELARPAPCFLCAETLWWRCHRRLIADLLAARGDDVLHLIRPGETRSHRFGDDVVARDGRLYVCRQLVA
jgi:uncharacterized protein (DUF488 family)